MSEKGGIEKAVVQVCVERVYNLGNFENIKIGLVATIGPENPSIANTLRALDKATRVYVEEYYSDRIGGKGSSGRGGKFSPNE